MMFLRTLNLDEFPRNLLLRLARILPFEVRNMYTRGLKLKKRRCSTSPSVGLARGRWQSRRLYRCE